MPMLLTGKKIRNRGFTLLQSPFRGFTFIELCVVISILLSISGMLSVWLGNFLAAKETYLEAEKISSMSNLAKELSCSESVNYRVCFNLISGKYRITGLKSDGAYTQPSQVKEVTIKEKVRIKSFSSPRSIYTEASGGLNEDYVTFYPDGTCEAAKLVMVNDKGEVYSLIYAASLGDVKVYNYETEN